MNIFFKVMQVLSWIAGRLLIALFIVLLVLVFLGPAAWIKMGLLVECKHVKNCAAEHGIEYEEAR
ncbi:hypothetical protein [Stenotrophomonas maltophilia]|uniref:Transmembrane protein n=1 Tax=Stenotrophomonas maltophilia TaxID=40324 RepID=A0AAJ2JC45_STEMA|nr:hypothetical protein [Stenotrophomonas maltophilia]MDT3468941.1 hypothetical protein [Stenotrophomonas maltophilia]